MIRNQQPGPPSPLESGRHASGLWCVQCVQLGHTKQFCRVGQNRDQRMIGGHLHKTKRVRDKISMVRVIIEDLFLEVRLVRMWKEKSFILFVESGMHKVNVGPKVRVTVVVIVEEYILQMSVANLTKSLGCLNLWPICTNRRETICEVLGHKEDLLMTLGRRIFIMTMRMLGRRSTCRRDYRL